MVTLEDLDGAIDVLLFPSSYQLASTLLTEDAIITVRGRLSRSKDQPEVHGQEVTLPDLTDGPARPGRDQPAVDAVHRRRSSSSSRRCSAPTRASPRCSSSCCRATSTTVLRLDDRLRVTPTPGAVRRPQAAAGARVSAELTAPTPTRHLSTRWVLREACSWCSPLCAVAGAVWPAWCGSCWWTPPTGRRARRRSGTPTSTELRELFSAHRPLRRRRRRSAGCCWVPRAPGLVDRVELVTLAPVVVGSVLAGVADARGRHRAGARPTRAAGAPAPPTTTPSCPAPSRSRVDGAFVAFPAGALAGRRGRLHRSAANPPIARVAADSPGSGSARGNRRSAVPRPTSLGRHDHTGETTMSSTTPPPEGPGGPEYLDQGGGEPVGPSVDTGRRRSPYGAGRRRRRRRPGARRWRRLGRDVVLRQRLPAGRGAPRLHARLRQRRPRPERGAEDRGVPDDREVPGDQEGARRPRRRRRPARARSSRSSRRSATVSYDDDVKPWLGYRVRRGRGRPRRRDADARSASSR